MIDLLKNYKELRNAPGYVSSIRYYLAKKKLDTLFVKWLSSHPDQVDDLLKKAQTGKLKATEYACIIKEIGSQIHCFHIIEFLTIHTQINQPSTSAIQLLHQELHMILVIISTLSVEKQNKKKVFNETHNGQSLIQSQVITKSIPQELKNAEIPQFYFPNGKPLDTLTEQTNKSSINTIIGEKNELTPEIVKSLTVDVLGLPNYFSILVMLRCSNNIAATKITKVEFNRVWKILEGETLQYRAYWLISSHEGKKFITIDDFKKLFVQILNIHPGLDFLREQPEFQDWYSLCVIHRMYYMANRKYDYKMTYRQFKKSNILKSLWDIENQADINANTDFFSYEDFYVIYLRFWELDTDHDFFLTKEELSKYSGYTLSRKTIERIFSQTVKRFQEPDKMGFGDFVWFIIAVEDKTTEQSIQYWFKIMDLDGNAIVTGYELEYFYQEQSQRLAYMDSSLDFNFENIICQMIDLFKPEKGLQFTLDDFLKRKVECSVFINMLTDLNKLVGFEQRDAYEERTVKQENPTWTDWDRFVKPEYRRMENSPDNDEGGEVLNWENDD